MKSFVKVCLLAALIVVLTPGIAKGLSEDQKEEDSGISVIIKFQDSINLDVLDGIPHTIHHTLERLDTIAVTLPEEHLSSLKKEHNHLTIEEDEAVFASTQEEGWGYQSIGRPNKSSMNLSGEGVKVAVIDTGIRVDHPDLYVAGGESFVEDVESFDDDNGHGTHVAGIIAAQNNEVGIVGVAPGVDLYGVKVLDSDGFGRVSSILAGIEWAIEQEMDLINLSLTACSPSSVTEEVIKDARSEGISIVAASGNKDVCVEEGMSDVLYPSRYEEVISVGAVSKDGSGSEYTYGGPSLDFTAPGLEINSTYIETENTPAGYREMSGSSMAAPFVTGTLALYQEIFPGLTQDELLMVATNNTVDLGTPGKDPIFGSGFIQTPTTPFRDFERGTWYSVALEAMAEERLISGYEDQTFRPSKEITREEVVSIIGRALDLNGENTESRFTDVKKVSFGSGYIESGVDKGFVHGYPDGTFKPKDSITRGDVALLIQQAYQIEGTSDGKFEDVQPKDYYYQSVHALKDSGLISGYPDGDFRPEKKISRAEVSHILAKAESM